MARATDTNRLRHMLTHAKEAVGLAQGRTRSDLETDRMLNLSLVRLLEIVGEAATRVTRPTQQQLPQIPWPQIIGLRNRLIHGYDEVDFDILWDIIQLDLPPLIAVLDTVLAGSGNTEAP